MRPPPVYPFDILPVHPQPEPLESFTGYLTRLAEANRIRMVHQLFGLCFPEGRRGFTLNNGDYLPRSFGALPAITGCPEPMLRATTFDYLAQKFGRRSEPHPMSLFMSGVVSPGLRYCPDCLAERGYHALTWRFLPLEGCPDHSRRLLDQCRHCGQKIPLLTQPLKVVFCPVCGGDLRTCQADRLNDAAQRRAQAWSQDLTFLLSPLAGEPPDTPVVQFIGQQFFRWRQVRRLKAADAAAYIEQSPAVIYFIEKGSEQRTTKLQWYFRYADLLKIRFATMFDTPLPPQPERTFEDKLAEKVEHALVSLKQQGVLATREMIAELIGVAPVKLRGYPRVKALCTTGYAKSRHRQETVLLEQARQMATRALEETGQPLSQRELYRRLGWSLSKFNTHPQTKAALKQMFEQLQEQYTDRVLSQLQAAVDQLEATGQPVTKQALSLLVGVSLKKMAGMPRVNRFLHELMLDQKAEGAIKKFQQREQALILEIEQAMETLTQSKQPVTRTTIQQLLKRNRSSLELYPRVQLLLKEVTLAKEQR